MTNLFLYKIGGGGEFFFGISIEHFTLSPFSGYAVPESFAVNLPKTSFLSNPLMALAPISGFC